jgi:hypothetical protein
VRVPKDEESVGLRKQNLVVVGGVDWELRKKRKKRKKRRNRERVRG